MTGPLDDQPTREMPVVGPTVSTAPPHRSRWSAIPSHLGRARTSTLVLSALFLTIGALYLNVRPDPAASVTPAPTTSVAPTAPAEDVPSTTAPTTSTVPTTTEETPASTTASPGRTTTGTTTGPTTRPTSESTAPSTPASTSRSSLPMSGSTLPTTNSAPPSS